MDIGATLGNRYALTAELGRGAMGVVYKAADAQTGQNVAIKVIARDLALDAEMLERFRREGEALRQLRHPNIVGFVDMFPHEGQQVIVMEFAPGGSLRDLLRREGPLPLERARQITLDLCDALIRAHRLNIIHRDLKPENVLLAEDGLPRLTDFGVARLANKSTYLTATGMQVGTPLYMSPEAWEGKPLDPQTDIWSLGVMLFEMLSGNVPFSGDTMVTVMNKVLTQPVPDLKALRRDVPDGLVQIVRRMLTRDKGQRYPTARQVSADLEACALDGSATVPERRLTASKMPALRQRSALLIGAAVVLVVVCGAAALGLGLAWRGLAGMPTAPAAPAASRTPSLPTNSPVTQALSAPAATVAPLPARPTDTTAPQPAAPTTETPALTAAAPAAGLPPAPPITVANAATLGQVSFAKASPGDLALAPDGKTLLVASNFSLAAYDLGNLDQPLYQVQGIQDVGRLALSPDGRLVALGGYSGVITLWDMAKGGVKLPTELKGHTEPITGLAFSPDGKLLASAGGRDNTMRLWDVASGKEIMSGGQGGVEIGSVAFSPDGATVAAGAADKKIRLYDVASSKMKLVLDAQTSDVGNIDSLLFSPDGKLLVSAGQYDAAIHVWDTQTWQGAAILHGSNMGGSSYGYDSLAFNRAGTLLATGGHDFTVRLWDMDPASPTHNKELVVAQRHSDEVSSVLFTPDGGTLISGSARDGTVRLWQASAEAAASAATPLPPTPATPAPSPITALNAAALDQTVSVKSMGAPGDVVLAPDGKTLVLALDFEIAVYDLGKFDAPLYKLSGSNGAGRIALSPDGQLLATADSGGPITLWDLSRGGVKVGELQGHTEMATDLAFSPDGKLLASAGGRDKSMQVWEVANAMAPVAALFGQADVGSVAFSPDSATLVEGCSDHKIRVWDVPSLIADPKKAKAKLELDAQTGGVGGVDSVRFSPDGKLLVSAGQYDSAIHVWDTQTWKATLVLHPTKETDTSRGYNRPAFNQAGTLLAAGGMDYAVHLWDMDPASATFGKELAALQRHSDWVTSVLFTPDGATLISGSGRDGTLRLWQVGPGK